MADVFISYASEDRQRIKPLAEALESRGFSVWWDRALGAGEDYASVITRELRAAKAVIVVWTDAASASTFVRDEAGRARDEGRLVPVLLDRVEIPLGFGAFQAEDFSAWNGQPNAPQVQLLEEALRAKLEGRAIDGGVVAAKRRRLMTRIRVVSVLSVIAALVGIAAGVNTIVNRPEVVQAPPRDTGQQLLDLLNQGKLTPEQAIELARLLETQALGEVETAENETGAVAPGAPAPTDTTVLAEAPDAAAPSLGTSSVRGRAGEAAPVAAVDAAEAEAAARETFRRSMASLLTAPDPAVRTAALQLSRPAQRDAAMRTLMAYAEANPAQSADIYRVVGAVGVTNDSPLAQTALEEARNVNPQDAQVWRMLSWSYRRNDRAREASGAALVSEGLAAQAQGQTAIAEQRLAAALPQLQAPEGRAFVEGALGDAAAARNDWAAASQRYEAALDLRARAAPDAPVAQALQVDAQKLVRALDRDGRTAEACRQARAVQAEHEEVAVDPELARRCEQLRIQVRPALQPAQRALTEPQVQRAP